MTVTSGTLIQMMMGSGHRAELGHGRYLRITGFDGETVALV